MHLLKKVSSQHTLYDKHHIHASLHFEKRFYLLVTQLQIVSYAHHTISHISWLQSSSNKYRYLHTTTSESSNANLDLYGLGQANKLPAIIWTPH